VYFMCIWTLSRFNLLNRMAVLCMGKMFMPNIPSSGIFFSVQMYGDQGLLATVNSTCHRLVNWLIKIQYEYFGK
jgi:hypothetical protein